MCSKAKSPLRTTVRQCVSSLGGVHLRQAVARSSINIILLNMQSMCAPVCSAELWCVFDTTHFYWVQHWYCCNAAPSFSEHTYDIPLRDALWVIFWVRGTVLYLKSLYALKRAVNRPNSNRAVFRDRVVKISVHYTAIYRPPHCARYNYTRRSRRRFQFPVPRICQLHQKQIRGYLISLAPNAACQVK